MKPRATAAALSAFAALALVGCTGQPAPSATTPAPSAVDSATAAPEAPAAETREVVTGLAAPWSVTILDDGTPLVSERDAGVIREILPDGTTRVIGTVQGVVHGGEGGLLGIAARGDELYVYSTGAEGGRIQSFAVDGGAGALALGAATTIIDGLPSAATHNGGRIAFGPDGMLYATVGDAGTPARAQDVDSLGGKLLRLSPDGEVPDDNPFPGSPVYSYGHRNPQGIAWTADGTLLLAEFGQNTWDELNVITPGGNYGWPEVEGIGGDPEFVDPVQQWPTDQASPSGLAVAGGSVYIANLRGERLRVIPVDDLASARDVFGGQYGRLRDAVAAPDGTLWIVTNNTDTRGTPRPGDDRIVSIPLPLA